MGPSQPFKSAVLGLLPNAPKTITSADITKHNSQEITYYVISKMVYKNNILTDSTSPFTGKSLLIVRPGADFMRVPDHLSGYKRVSPIELLSHGGKNFLAWVAEGNFAIQVTIVKIISPDGVTQFKVISKDQTEQRIYNVCELPSHLISQL